MLQDCFGNGMEMQSFTIRMNTRSLPIIMREIGGYKRSVGQEEKRYFAEMEWDCAINICRCD